MLTIGYLVCKSFQRSSKRDGNIKIKNKFRERKREWNWELASEQASDSHNMTMHALKRMRGIASILFINEFLSMCLCVCVCVYVCVCVCVLNRLRNHSTDCDETFTKMLRTVWRHLQKNRTWAWPSVAQQPFSHCFALKDDIYDLRQRLIR